MLEKGYIQVYTGNGKGKTTSALGLALRASGAGLKVLIVQFLKGLEYSEHKVLKDLPNVDFELFGRADFIHGKPTEEDRKLCKKGLERVRKGYREGYDVIVLDEANVAVHLGAMDLKDLLETVKSKPENVEIVITGRYAPKELIELADLVTEMKEVKHYYRKGIIARRGIEM